MAKTEKEEEDTDTDTDTAVVDVHIPGDVVAEIMMHLPPVDLINSMTVCKQWLQLISSPDFTRRYNNATRCQILLPLPHENEIIHYNCCTRTSEKIKYPKVFCRENFSIMGACDGLVCMFSQWTKKMAVFNPATGECQTGVIDCHYSSSLTDISWFGRHPSTGEYVMVLGESSYKTRKTTIEVRYLSSKLRTVAFSGRRFPLVCYPQKIGTPLRGRLHWPAASCGLGSDENGVVAYDFDENKLVQIRAPGRSSFRIVVKEGRLALTMKVGAIFEMWIMEEYGVKESWSRIAKLEGLERWRVMYPIGFLPNGDLMMDAGDGDRRFLTSYSFATKKAKRLRHRWRYFSFSLVVCAKTSVSPNIF